MAGAKETLNDLNSLLFEQIERLGNSDLQGNSLKEEIERSRAVSSVATQIINNANTMLSAAKFYDSCLSAEPRLPKMLGGGED